MYALTFHALQPPTLARHRVLMQPMTITILTRPMDFDEERDSADQGPLTDMDMEEDAEMLALLLKHMPSCIYAADIEQLVRDIQVPVQLPVVVPVSTVQEAVAAEDLPPLDADAANVFSRSELILQEHVGRTRDQG